MMNDKQIRETRRLAWLFLFFFIAVGALKLWQAYTFNSFVDGFREEALSIHYRHVREIQSLAPTAENVNDTATNYLYLGVGAIGRLDDTHGLVKRSYVTAILICVIGILFPIRVLRTVTTGDKGKQN